MPKVREIFAYVAYDQNPDDEGIMAFLVGDRWMPMVGADMERMQSLKAQAIAMAKSSGKKIVLLRFSTRETLWSFNP